jgi:uncharacterized protein
MQQRISLITLAVEDLDRAAKFYEALGWQKEDAEAELRIYNLLGQSIGLYPRENLARDMGLEPSEIGGFSGVTFAHNVADRSSVDDIATRAQAVGARMIKPPHEVFWGGYIAYFADLDGHVWEVAHNPFSKLGPKGEFRWGGYPD